MCAAYAETHILSAACSALDVIFFVREIMETNSGLRQAILTRLLESFDQIRSSRVCSCTLWIVGEYCQTLEDVEAALEVKSRDINLKSSRAILATIAAASCPSHTVTTVIPEAARLLLRHKLNWDAAAKMTVFAPSACELTPSHY